MKKLILYASIVFALIESMAWADYAYYMYTPKGTKVPVTIITEELPVPLNL